MENYDITALREWAPLTDILEKIPSRIQKGLFSSNLNITCIDVIPEYIAFGTDAGIIFWYNRYNGDVQKLRAEISAPFTCVKIVSSVEYMVAAGSTNGQVSVFQIQKDIPEDLNLFVSLMKTKPIERYTIRDLHNSMVTCCEWSKNGMRLYSGDKNGIVVQTEFDYQAHLSKSVEILNEAYGIVQLNVYQSYLLVSTIYRSIICKREQIIQQSQSQSEPQHHQHQQQQHQNSNKWKILQIGKKDRKILHEFGAAFRDTKNIPIKKLQIVCSRPGLRLWFADINGNVEQTLIYKDTIESKPLWNIPLLNPAKNFLHSMKSLVNFGKMIMLTKNYVLTYDDKILVILNIEKLCIEAIAKGFRNINDVCINEKEIFILEGTRSVIRLSVCPEPPNKTSKIIYNPLLPPPIPNVNYQIFERPIEFEAEDDIIINAEECFEAASLRMSNDNLNNLANIPIESENASIVTSDISSATQQNQLIMEQSLRRIEIFDKINEMKFDDSILFRSGVGKKHKKDTKSSRSNSGSRKKSKNGIVEIGQTANELNESISSASIVSEKSSDLEATMTPTATNATEISDQKFELTTRPFLMEVSFCTDTFLLPDLRSPDTIKRVLEVKEKALAEELNLEPIKLVEISDEDIKNATDHLEKSNLIETGISSTVMPSLPVLQYPINYPFTTAVKVDDAEVQTTPRKKLHFINDDDDDENDEIDSFRTNETAEAVFKNTTKMNNTANDEINLCENFKKNVMVQSDCTFNVRNNLNDGNKMTKSLQFIKCNVKDDDDDGNNYYGEGNSIGSSSKNNDISPSVPDIKNISEFMKIPSIWNEKIERIDCYGTINPNNGKIDNAIGTATKTITNNDEQDQSDSQTSGDWEFVD